MKLLKFAIYTNRTKNTFPKNDIPPHQNSALLFLVK